MSHGVPAVVVGAGINGLGVLRSLARAKIPVTVLDSNARQPAMRSRYGRKITFANDKTDAVVDALEALANELDGERPVLILTQEQTVYSVSMHRQRLLPLYRVTLPTHDVLMSLMHKDGFRIAAEQSGAAVPRTLHVTQASTVDTLSTLTPPLVVKPSIRDANYSAVFRKAYRVDSVDEAQNLVCRILPVLPDVIVQEWIEGSDSDIYFCLQYTADSGNVAASFVGRKIRSWPPRVGGTASCAPAPEHEAETLVQRTSEFFKRTGVRGFASMEYKRDARSGEFFMVEPTLGRTDYQEEVATLNGVNMPLAAYRAELGLSPMGVESRKPVRVWRDRAADRQSAASAGGDRPWQPDNAHAVNALERASDPMPAIHALTERASRRAIRLLSGS